MRTINDPFVIANLEDDTGFLLLQISRLWDEYHDRVLKKLYNMTNMQYAVLASVYWLALRTKKEVTQIVLSKHTKIDPMTISQIFKVLEARGYIYRKTHSTDVRAKSIFLTPEGEELMSKAVRTIVDLDSRFFRIIGENIKQFNRCMVTLLKENDQMFF